MYQLSQKLLAEFIGTMILLMVVIGSGIMGAALSNNDGLALLANTIATGAGLCVLIILFAPISGAHFNPVVTLAFMLKREIPIIQGFLFFIVQIIGGIVGVILANMMFDLDMVQISTKIRASHGVYVSEIIATFGLVLLILNLARLKSTAIPYAVGLYITAAYWFTASTSFANPAVTIARQFSDTFAGIAPNSVLMFIAMQLIGMSLAMIVSFALKPKID